MSLNRNSDVTLLTEYFQGCDHVEENIKYLNTIFEGQFNGRNLIMRAPSGKYRMCWKSAPLTAPPTLMPEALQLTLQEAQSYITNIIKLLCQYTATGWSWDDKPANTHTQLKKNSNYYIKSVSLKSDDCEQTIACQLQRVLQALQDQAYIASFFKMDRNKTDSFFTIVINTKAQLNRLFSGWPVGLAPIPFFPAHLAAIQLEDGDFRNVQLNPEQERRANHYLLQQQAKQRVDLRKQVNTKRVNEDLQKRRFLALSRLSALKTSKLQQQAAALHAYEEQAAKHLTAEKAAWRAKIESYMCSLALDIMMEPVTLTCGHHFEKSALIDMQLNLDRWHCPICNCPIFRDLQRRNDTSHIKTNISLKNEIQSWLIRGDELGLSID